MLVTAGPTRERIDSIRFISNLSTGFMGYEIARAAKRKGHAVTLISGPTNLEPPRGVNFVRVENARQMSRAVVSRLGRADCLFMASAVSDWRPAGSRAGKIKKADGARQLRLVKNPDILYQAGRKKGRTVLIGFALEAANLEKNAEEKLKKKNLDIIAANKINARFDPFGKGKTDFLVIDRTGSRKWLRRVSKKQVASSLLSRAEKLLRY